MNRPYCILSSAMSVDGKIATARFRDSSLSSKEDWKRVHQLRNDVDAIMVGRKTVEVDNPKLVVKEGLIESKSIIKNPLRVVPDSKALVSPKSQVITYAPEVPTIIAVSDKAPLDRKRKLQEAGAEVIVLGKEKVNLKKLMNFLSEKGCKTILLEGGGRLNWSMFTQGLIDELRLSIAPVIIGGEDSISLFGGIGFEKIKDSPLLTLENKEMFGDCLVVTYMVKYNQNRILEI